MNKLSQQRKRVYFWALLSIFGAFLSLLYLASNGNSDQIFDDIICEYTSIFQSNKSAECNLLFGLIFGGMLIYTLFMVISKSKVSNKENMNVRVENMTMQKSKEFICALLAMSIVSFLIFNGTHQIVVASLLYALIVYLIDGELVCAGICTFYMGVYTFIGLFRIYNYLGGTNSVNNMMVATFALTVSFIPLAFSDKQKVLCRVAMIEGVFVPSSLLVYLSNKYMYEG